MDKIKLLFLDIGGVLLSDGWNHASRLEAIEKFDLDPIPFQKDHATAFPLFENGKLTLDEYLECVVFNVKRDFSKAEFSEFMFSRTSELPDFLPWLINWKKETERTKQALLDLGFDIDVRIPVGALGGAARTGVAIARALQETGRNISILILDEPTANLPGADVDRLFDAVRRLKARGIAVVFVSHHLEEVFEIADRVTVLRDAKVVATVETKELDMSSLIELIVGHKVTAANVNRSVDQSLAPRLSVQNLIGPGMDNVSIDVRPGEVLGVAGLTGSGRDTLIPLLSGAIDRIGDVYIDGVVIPAGSPNAAISAGLAFVPADRLRNGIISMMSVRSNCPAF